MCDVFIPLEINAERVCNAISKIGYSAHSAVMDIVDNSVRAGATKVIIEIIVDEDCTLGERNNVIRYNVIDNGDGMDSDGIQNALKLGSDDNYEKESLSKYGMGLKAAGFSLGDRVEVISRRDGTLSDLYYLDKNVIRERGYCVGRSTLEKEGVSLVDSALDETSGTIVSVVGCSSSFTSQQSANTTLKYLSGRIGVVYFYHLKKGDLEITIRRVRKDNIDETVVGPRDILHLDSAGTEFDEAQYDCLNPCKVLDCTVPVDIPDCDNYSIQAVIFPQNRMKNFAEFSGEQQQQVASYGVGKANSGFFIYRNNRLIRWGDKLGIVSRDQYGFRAVIRFKTEHDEYFHVDVSKQRLHLPEKVIEQLKVTVRQALYSSERAFSICTDKFLNLDEGHQFNERNEDLEVEDFEELVSPPSPADREDSRKRRDALVAESDIVVEAATAGDDGVPPAVFEKIRYSDKITAEHLWIPGSDTEQGHFVLVNKNHPFYQMIMRTTREGSPERQAMEALLWSAAVAENLTATNLHDVDADSIRRVFRKFKAMTSSTLISWCAKNQDLEEK